VDNLYAAALVFVVGLVLGIAIVVGSPNFMSRVTAQLCVTLHTEQAQQLACIRKGGPDAD
jgi:phosphohistidine swiveling domain-containing protein